jgi:hypothetical protein
MAGLWRTRSSELARDSAALSSARRERAEAADALVALRRELDRVEAGRPGDPRAHLRHEHHPVPPEEIRYGQLVEVWSAVSVAIMLVVVAGLIWSQLAPWWLALAIGIGGYLVIESALRRRLTLLTQRTVLFLAILGAIVLAWELRTLLVLAGIVGLALVVFADNLREVRIR